MKRPFILLLLLLYVAIPPSAFSQNAEGRTAPLLDGMGTHHRSIVAATPLVQRYFDQGFVLALAFNHAEAARAFREAQRLDPNCAMCAWGEALVLGPNINAPMNAEDVPEAWAALQRAQALAASESPANRALIEALAARYTAEPVEDRTSLDRAYAGAMRTVAARFRDDADVQALFAESIMDTMPWDYWNPDGTPKPATEEVLAVLERARAINPNHPLALHLWIHAVEKQRPELGIEAAERLGSLVPGAGHLVHMPGHIWIRVGRYHEGSLANERAIEADRAYITQCHAQGLYPIGYVPHNYHFLWATATLEGRRDKALWAAREMAKRIDHDQMRQPVYGTLQHYWITPLYALVRFSQWEAILDWPKPADDLIYPKTVWHYARAMAFIRTGRLDQAEQELALLRERAADPALEEITVWDINTTAHLMKIATKVVSGELAAARGRYDAAIQHLRAGVQLEDALTYDEPPTWHHPVRQTLGTVLLKADRPADAEQVYREDLEIYPENGWSLYGLAQSLRAQGKTAEANAVQARFEDAWKHADIALTASRL